MAQAQQLDRLVSRGAALLSIGPDETVRLAAAEMSKHNVGSLLVLDGNGTLIGIVSERDVLAKVVAKGLNPIAVRVAEIMSRNVVTCQAKSSTGNANRLMAVNKIRHLPIVADGNPVGMVSARDLMAHKLDLALHREREHRRRVGDLERTHPGITRLIFDDVGHAQI
ncbi:MAG: CBS domain-containing protein [Planctomycetes bacterium]|jgi:CBS domain-containing protein|nr:CBS domain-containing protein [Phycisphaerae bacterium]NBB94724.1 CBS domain-containing protein [Planctomycetota bacterium]